MNELRIVLNYTRMKILSFFCSQRLIVSGSYMLIMGMGLFDGIRRFCEETGYNISVYSYPHLVATQYMRLLIMVGAVLLFMDAPFIDNLSWTLMSKMGKKLWVLANTSYIFCMSILYTLSCQLVLLMGLSGRQSLLHDWGKVMYTLARNTDLYRQYGIKIIYSSTILERFTPVEAMLQSAALSILQFAIIGLLIHAVSLFFRTNWAGILAACLYILSENYLSLAGNPRWKKLLPITYLDLAGFEEGINKWTIRLEVAYLILGVLVLVLIVLAWIRLKSMDIEIYKELE